MVDGMRILGIYEDPNNTQHDVTFAISDLHNIDELIVVGEPIELDGYIANTDEKYNLLVKNIERMQEGFAAADQHSQNGNEANYITEMERARFRTEAYQFFTYVYGPDYHIIDGTEHDKDYVTKIMLDFVTAPSTLNAFRPMLVDNKYLGRRPAAFVFNQQDAFILFNKDQELTAESRNSFYVEELGSLVRWNACKLLNVSKVHDACFTVGDEGARFAALSYYDLAFLSEQENASFTDFLVALPSFQKQTPVVVEFKDNSVGYINGFRSLDHYGDFIAGGDKGQTMAIVQLGVEVPSEFKAIYEKFAIQFVYYAPRLKSLADPTRADKDTPENNVPTLWLQVAFHDEINAFVGRLNGVPSTVTSVGDAGAIVIRNHGLELPFQMIDGGWKFQEQHMNYYKEDILRLELDFKLIQFLLPQAQTPLVKLPVFTKINSGTQATVGLEMGLAFKFPFENKTQFYGAIGTDVATNILGAAIGAGFGAFSGEDPVTFGEVGAIIGDFYGTGLEEAFFGSDKAQWVGVTASLPFDYNLSFGGKSSVNGAWLNHDPSARYANGFNKKAGVNGVFALYPRYAYTIASHASNSCGLFTNCDGQTDIDAGDILD